MTNGGLMDRILASLGRIPLTAIKDGSAPSSMVPSWDLPL